MGFFDKHLKTVEHLNDDCKSAVFAIAEVQVKNINKGASGTADTSSPMTFLILELFKDNYELRKEIEKLNRAHEELMLLFANEVETLQKDKEKV